MTKTVPATTVRMAGMTDREAIQDLWETVGLDPATPEEWSALVDNSTSTVLVAQDGGVILGAAVATFDGWRAYIYHVAVDPVRRHEGIGGALLEEAERYLRSAGARWVFVMVHQENTDGLALVAASDYLPEGEFVWAKSLAPA